MTLADIWAEEIGADRDAEGQPSLEAVLAHIRGAVIETGFVSQGRITRGLKEAYRPLGIDEQRLRATIDGAIGTLLLSGDFDEFTTGAGRGYIATPPRRVAWNGEQVAVLGSAEGGDARARVRRVAVGEVDSNAITMALADELGRPEWRSALVDLGAADTVDHGVGALFNFATTLAASGERYSLDEPQTVAVLSGRGQFFGQSEHAPVGRWQRVAGDGCFPAVIKSGFTSRYVVLSIAEGAATLWQPASRDLWRWVVLGATIAAGDPVVHYDQATQRLDFLTPPPRQIERAVLLTGAQTGAWSWKVDQEVHRVIDKLIMPAR